MPKRNTEIKPINGKALGERVQAARINAHMQVLDLADKIGVSEIFVRHIELGRRLPSLTVFIALCNALHVAPSYFVSSDLDLGLDDPVQMAIDLLSECTPKQGAMLIDMLATGRKHIKNEEANLFNR